MSLDKKISRAVFLRDNWHCRHCNSNQNLDPHHVIYKSAGGADTLDNLITLCRACHDGIHTGRIKVEVVMVLEKEGDIIVKFWKRGGYGRNKETRQLDV